LCGQNALLPIERPCRGGKHKNQTASRYSEQLRNWGAPGDAFFQDVVVRRSSIIGVTQLAEYLVRGGEAARRYRR